MEMTKRIEEVANRLCPFSPFFKHKVEDVADAVRDELKAEGVMVLNSRYLTDGADSYQIVRNNRAGRWVVKKF